MLNAQNASLVILHSTLTFLLYSTFLRSLQILPNMGEREPDLSSIFSLISGLYRLFQQSGLSLAAPTPLSEVLIFSALVIVHVFTSW